jgi:hypothetical protein
MLRAAGPMLLFGLIDQVPDGIRLVQGMTATVEIHHREKP